MVVYNELATVIEVKNLVDELWSGVLIGVYKASGFGDHIKELIGYKHNDEFKEVIVHAE